MKNKTLLKNILLYLGFAIIISGNVFKQTLSNLDEVWIYNFARCIADGLLPYKDISMIITPLFSIICAGMLKVFGNEMIILRIFEVIEVAAILFIIYKIMLRLKMNKGISLLLVIRNLLYLFRNNLF